MEEKEKQTNENPTDIIKYLGLPEYTYEDFATSDAPYKELYEISDRFEQAQRMEQLTLMANEVKYKNFKGTYKKYVESIKNKLKVQVCEGHISEISGPYMQLDCGKYAVDDNGIRGFFDDKEIVICHHPIIPIEILQNVDTGEEKVKIAYRPRDMWLEQIVSKEVLYNSRQIVQLVKCGVDVSSETAKYLVSYFQEIEALNRNILPLRKSVTRLGYIGNSGFSPFVDNLNFDGDVNYSRIFNAITSKGNFDKWLEIANKCRNKSVIARIIVAASFASALIQSIGGLPFFVHLWGIDSGTGKTVGLMLAASVWGNPKMGEYVQTFNGTQVGHERTAAFLNSLPMCIDELQLSKDSHGKSRFDVYQLAQGVGRTRGTKTGGIERTPTWGNTILTTGESPIVGNSAGAGAVNRVIDIECTSKNYVIQDGPSVLSIINKNYGFAGRIFVERIQSTTGVRVVKETYDDYFKKLCDSDTTEKQAMAAAMILTADLVAEAEIFKTGKALSIKDISPFLKSKESVSAGERGYAYICDWVAANSKRFVAGEENNQEIYGVIQDDYAFIIRSKFDEVMEKQGFDSRAILSWLKVNNKILTRGRRLTKGKRINGVNTECVALKLPEEEPEYFSKEELNGLDLNEFEPL